MLDTVPNSEVTTVQLHVILNMDYDILIYSSLLISNAGL